VPYDKYFSEKSQKALEDLSLDGPSFLRHTTRLTGLRHDEWERDPVESVGTPREVSNPSNWSNKPPTKEGWYFMKARREPHLICVVEVLASPAYPHRLCYNVRTKTLDGKEDSYREYVTIPQVDWAGPIPIPND
jgi:hypothetical protein